MKKTFLFFAIIAISVCSGAEAAEHNAKLVTEEASGKERVQPNYDKVSSWIKRNITETPGTKEFFGTSATGKECGLYLTVNSDNNFYVVVGMRGSNDRNDFVGVQVSPSKETPKSKIDASGSNFELYSDTTWGNKSKWNKLEISFDKNGRPIRAVGTSDRNAIFCTFSP